MKPPDKDEGKMRIAYCVFPLLLHFQIPSPNTQGGDVQKSSYRDGRRVPNQSQYITTHLWEPIYVLHANAQDTRGLVSGLWHSNLWSPLKKSISEGQWWPKKFTVQRRRGGSSDVPNRSHYQREPTCVLHRHTEHFGHKCSLRGSKIVFSNSPKS